MNTECVDFSPKSDFDKCPSARRQVESGEQWREWIEKIPSLRFDADWDVKVIPPFGGALARFQITKGDKWISVYLDGFSTLGWVYDDNDKPIPYYEIYPNEDGDVSRYYLNETEQMMKDIRSVLNAE